MEDYLDDRRLVKRLLAGDTGAFNEFYDGYFPRLYRFACARVGDDLEVAKEVVQIALTNALRKLHSYRAEAALFTWLCTICRREIASYYRKHKREREQVLLTEDHPEVQAAVESFRAPPSTDPEIAFRRLELIRLIQVALDQLPPHYGDALEWKYIEGHSVEEIAKRLGMGRDAAYSMLARARRAFHEVFGSLAGAIAGGRHGADGVPQ